LPIGKLLTHISKAHIGLHVPNLSFNWDCNFNSDSELPTPPLQLLGSHNQRLSAFFNYIGIALSVAGSRQNA